MTKDVLAELSKAPLVTKELMQYLAKQKIDANIFLVNATDVNAYAEFLIFFAETYKLYIRIKQTSIELYVNAIRMVEFNADLPVRGQITLSIVYAIRYANNPF